MTKKIRMLLMLITLALIPSVVMAAEDAATTSFRTCLGSATPGSICVASDDITLESDLTIPEVVIAAVVGDNTITVGGNEIINRGMLLVKNQDTIIMSPLSEISIPVASDTVSAAIVFGNATASTYDVSKIFLGTKKFIEAFSASSVLYGVDYMESTYVASYKMDSSNRVGVEYDGTIGIFSDLTLGTDDVISAQRIGINEDVEFEGNNNIFTDFIEVYGTYTNKSDIDLDSLNLYDDSTMINQGTINVWNFETTEDSVINNHGDINIEDYFYAEGTINNSGHIKYITIETDETFYIGWYPSKLTGNDLEITYPNKIDYAKRDFYTGTLDGGTYFAEKGMLFYFDPSEVVDKYITYDEATRTYNISLLRANTSSSNSIDFELLFNEDALYSAIVMDIKNVNNATIEYAKTGFRVVQSDDYDSYTTDEATTRDLITLYYYLEIDSDKTASANLKFSGFKNGEEITVNISSAIVDVNTIMGAFESNGGSYVSLQTLASGDKMAKPSNPTKTGYKFDKWYKDAALTQAFDFENDTITASTVLYAGWIAEDNPQTYDGGIALYILLGIVSLSLGTIVIKKKLN